MEEFKHISKEELDDLLFECDVDTQVLFDEDYIPNWDTKSLWKISPPFAMIVDGKLACIVFYNYQTIVDSTGEKVLYIQRTYTVPQFRKQGYFRRCIKAIAAASFDLNCRSMYMFCNTDFLDAWKKMFFVPVAKTRDGKYYLVVSPILCNDIEESNMVFIKQVVPETGSMNLKYFSSEFLLFLKGTIAKYC